MSDIYSLEITEKFLRRYCDLEKALQDEDCKRVLNRYSNRIKDIKEIRNIATHQSKEGNRPFIISKYLLDELEDILSKIDVKCIQIGVRKSNIAFVKKEDRLSKAIKTMAENNYTFLPILDNNSVLIGVISETAIVNVINKYNGEFIYDETVKVEENLEDFLISNNPNEFYLFCSRDDYLDDIQAQIEKGKPGKRFGACFVTENGNKREAVLSMFTVWDLLPR